LKVIIIFLVLISSLFSAQNPKEIIVVTESWKGATNRDGTGLYWAIMEKVYAPLGYTIVKKHSSYSRATELVQRKEADCWLGAYKDEKELALYPKYYFDQDVVIALYRSETIEVWRGQQSLEGLKVGWIRGYDFDKYLTTKVKKKELSGRKNGLKLLKSEHIDVFLDDKDDLTDVMETNNFSLKEYTKRVVFQLKLYPAFSKTPRGEKLMKIWDERMKNLIKKREFKEIYYNSNYALFPY